MSGHIFDSIYKIVERIPEGAVTTYGSIALIAGIPRGARVVGYAMRCAPDALPCHRVVNRLGELNEDIFHGMQRVMLEAEGVEFLESGRIDMKRFLWRDK